MFIFSEALFYLLKLKGTGVGLQKIKHSMLQNCSPYILAYVIVYTMLDHLFSEALTH